MKKFILMLLLVLTSFNVVDAQVQYYRTTQFAMKQMDVYGRWTNWSPWESSNILIEMDLNSDIITIYSQMRQVYKIVEYVGNYTDDYGGKQAEYRFIDQDFDKGVLRLRLERNNNAQIYVEFGNIIWVYNVLRVE